MTASAGTIEMRGSAAQTIGAGIFAGNTIKDLTINNSTGVTLQGALNISGVFTPTSGIFASGGNLTLVSSAAQTALISGTGSGSITGNVTMQRYLPSGFGYKYFSSPFQAATVNEFSDDMTLGALFPTFYRYDENHQTSGADVSGWTVYTAPGGLLKQMEGYAVNFGPANPPKTVDVTGLVSNGLLQLTLKNNNRTYTKGFNLVGNPYPSPIDWNKPGWTKTNIDNAIYFFNAGNTDQYTGVYSSYVNGVSSDLGLTNNIIASMQGFFVHVSNGAYPVNATLGVTNPVRTSDLNPLFKNAPADDRVILRFAANFETADAIDDIAVIYFDKNANAGFEKDIDALKMLNTDLLVPNLYTLSPDPEQLSINGMPLPADSITKIPIGITTLSNGWISFNAKDISQLSSTMNIYLVDAEKGITQNLKQNPAYRFYLETGVFNERFTLVFSLSEIDNPAASAQKMFKITRSADRLFVKMNLPFNTKGSLSVTNMAGQNLLRKSVFEKETVEISPYIITGIYIVNLISGERTESEKILIRKDYE